MADKLTIGFGIIAVVMIIFASFIAYNKWIGPDTTAIVTGDSTYAKYNPTNYIDKDWKLIGESRSLADFETDMRLGFIDGGTIDIALWDLKKDDEELHVWARKFDTRENLENAEKDFISPLVWNTYTVLLFGDAGIAGIRKIPIQNDPLSVYVDKDNIMIYSYYYNTKDQTGNPLYDDTDMANDKKFLIDLTKDMMGL